MNVLTCMLHPHQVHVVREIKRCLATFNSKACITHVVIPSEQNQTQQNIQSPAAIQNTSIILYNSGKTSMLIRKLQTQNCRIINDWWIWSKLFKLSHRTSWHELEYYQPPSSEILCQSCGQWGRFAAVSLSCLGGGVQPGKKRNINKIITAGSVVIHLFCNYLLSESTQD